MSDIKVALLHTLNVLDAVITLNVVHIGVEEANPLMAQLLLLSPYLFLGVKISVGVVAITFLDKAISDLSFRRRVFTILVGVYSLIIAWHIIGLFELLNCS